MDHKIDLKLGLKDKAKPSIFEKNKYLKTVFPTLTIQKPGRDYYGYTTLTLAVLSLFVLFGFDKVNVSQQDLLEDAGKQSDIFTTDTSLALLLNMILIIVERYINRANVIKSED